MPREYTQIHVPQMPALRWVLATWGVTFAAGTLALAVFGDPDPGGRVVLPMFGAVMLWAAWRWWHLGATITQNTVKLRGMWGSISIPRASLLRLRADDHRQNWAGRLLLGRAHERVEVVVDTQAGPQRTGRIGLTFVTRDGADQFGRRVSAAASTVC